MLLLVYAWCFESFVEEFNYFCAEYKPSSKKSGQHSEEELTEEYYNNT